MKLNFRILLILIFSIGSVTAEAQMGSVAKQILKKESKQTVKKTEKKAIKQIGKQVTKSGAKSAGSEGMRSATKSFSKSVLKAMNKNVLKVFTDGAYKEVKITLNGKAKSLLVSQKFDPYLKISRKYTGDFDPAKFHKGDSRYVIDGCETNLGRMKRGLAPLYKDPANKRVSDHGYSAFELHHGGQKANPDYFALMADDHKTQSSILHPIRQGSEINRNEFSKKERAPLYKEMAEYIDMIL